MLFWILLGVGIASALAYRASRAEAATPKPAPPQLTGPVMPGDPDWVDYTESQTSPPAELPKVDTSIVMPFPRGPEINISLALPEIAKWAALCHQVLPAHGIPPIYGLAWLGVESGGNACATGGRTATGPDGYPREVSLFQAYNPDDLKALGVTAEELCSFCVRPAVGPKKRPEADGGFLDGTERNRQQLAAPLTDEQSARQIEIGAGLIKLKRADADRYLQKNGVTWPATSPDYWAAVKCPHAWPPILAIGLGQVTKHLGRAPASWSEFRATYEKIEPLARYDAARAEAKQDQSPIYRGLRNCQWVGFHVPNEAP